VKLGLSGLFVDKLVVVGREQSFEGMPHDNEFCEFLVFYELGHSCTPHCVVGGNLSVKLVNLTGTFDLRTDKNFRNSQKIFTAYQNGGKLDIRSFETARLN